MLTPLRHLDKSLAYSMILKWQRQKQQNQTYHYVHTSLHPVITRPTYCITAINMSGHKSMVSFIGGAAVNKGNKISH